MTFNRIQETCANTRFRCALFWLHLTAVHLALAAACCCGVGSRPFHERKRQTHLLVRAMKRASCALEVAAWLAGGCQLSQAMLDVEKNKGAPELLLSNGTGLSKHLSRLMSDDVEHLLVVGLMSRTARNARYQQR